MAQTKMKAEQLAYFPNRNAIINGGMDVWQRGTSFAVGAITEAYTADRFNVYSGAGSVTLSRQAPALTGFRYCLRAQRDAGQTTVGNVYLSYTLETTDSIPFQGKAVTVSFYARKGTDFSSSSNSLICRLASGTGTDERLVVGFTNDATVVTSTTTLTTSWVRVSMTGTVGASVTQLGIMFVRGGTGTAGANDYCEITGVQLELGSVATPFEMRPYVTELALCLRYCYVPKPLVYGKIGIGLAISTTAAQILVGLPIEMRTVPILTATATDWQLSIQVNAWDLTTIERTDYHCSQTEIVIDAVVASGLTQGIPVFLAADGTADRIMVISAEL